MGWGWGWGWGKGWGWGWGWFGSGRGLTLSLGAASLRATTSPAWMMSSPLSVAARMARTRSVSNLVTRDVQVPRAPGWG